MYYWFIYNCLNQRGKKIIVHKSSPSNLLVDRTKSTVKLINFVLSLVVTYEFPNSNA